MRYHQFTNLTVMFFPINLLNWRYTVQSTVLQRPEIPPWAKSTSTTECRVTTAGFHSDNAQSSQSSLMLWSLRGAEPTVIYRLCSLYSFAVCSSCFFLPLDFSLCLYRFSDVAVAVLRIFLFPIWIILSCLSACCTFIFIHIFTFFHSLLFEPVARNQPHQAPLCSPRESSRARYKRRCRHKLARSCSEMEEAERFL